MLSRVVLLLLSSTVLSCVHKIVDARVIVGKRYVETDRNMLPELELDLLPDTSSELWKSVNTAFLQKNYKKIEDDMRKFLRANPAHPVALSLLVKALFLQKKYKLASYYADLVLTVNNNDTDAHMIKALGVIFAPNSYHYQRHAARLRLASLFAENKTHIASGLNLGIWMMKKGNCGKAMQYFAQVVRRCPKCGIARVGFAICLLRSGNFNRAHRLLLNINDDIEDTLAKYYLAFSYFKIKRNIAKARDILKNILNDKSQNGYIRSKARSLLVLIQDQSVARRNSNAAAQ